MLSHILGGFIYIVILIQIQQIQASSSGNNYNDGRPPPYNGNSDGPSNDSYVIEMERMDTDGLGAFLAKVVAPPRQ